LQYSYLNPKGLRLLLWFGISTAIFTSANSQAVKRLNHVSFNVNEGLLHSQVTDINEDGNGFIWLSTGSGVQRFDGKNFYRIPETNSDNGISDDKYVKFFRLKNGNLLLIHSKGISEYNIHSNRFARFGTDSMRGYTPVWEDSEAIWFAKFPFAIYRITKEKQVQTDSIALPHNAPLDFYDAYQPANEDKCLLGWNAETIWILKAKEARNAFYKAGPEQKKFFGVAYYKNDTAIVAT